MARIHARTIAQPPSERGGSTPWVVFVSVLVLAMIAGLAALLIAMQPGDGVQTNGSSALHAPSLPADKMPSFLPVRPH